MQCKPQPAEANHWSRRLHMTSHAQQRATQRRVSLEEIEVAVAHGRRQRVYAGAVVYRLDRRRIALLRSSDTAAPSVREGLHVVVHEPTGSVLTVYIHRQGRHLRDLRGHTR